MSARMIWVSRTRTVDAALPENRAAYRPGIGIQVCQGPPGQVGPQGERLYAWVMRRVARRRRRVTRLGRQIAALSLA